MRDQATRNRPLTARRDLILPPHTKGVSDQATPNRPPPRSGTQAAILAALRDYPGVSRDRLVEVMAERGRVMRRGTLATAVGRLKRLGRIVEPDRDALFNAAHLAEATVAAARLQTRNEESTNEA